MKLSFNISNDQLESIFPFHMILDYSLTIFSAGKSLKKLIPDIIGKNMFSIFESYLTNITPNDFHSLQNFENSILFLKWKDDPRILLRYQVLNFREQNQILFVGTLNITQVELLDDLDLQLSDFAPHNSITEMLQLIKSKEMVMTEMNEILSNYKKQKTEIQQYKDNLIAIINTIPTAILVEDATRKIVYTNVQFCEMFNIPQSPDQMIGFDCNLAEEQAKELYNDKAEFSKRIHLLLSLDVKTEGEMLCLKDGRILIRDFIPIHSNGETTGIIWQYKDVTKQKLADQYLKMNEEKYRGLIENLHLGLLEVDLSEYITHAYPTFCSMTGYTEEEIIGKNAIEFLIHPDDKIKILSESKKRPIGLNSVYEVRMRKKNGNFFWVIISGAPLYNIKNEVIGSIGIHWDISSHKQKETELKIAKEEAENSSQAKKIFMAKMSHELRTPLNAIIGMTQFLNDTPLTEEQKEDLEVIQNSSENLLNIVNDLIDIAKIEAGKTILNIKPFSLKSAIMESFHQHYYMAREKNIELKLQFDPEVSEWVKGDGQKIIQILTNLLSNAIKFTAQGEIILKHRYEGGLHVITIIDTGIGIEENKQKEIFNPFVQGSTDTAIQYGGTGLGLTITKEFIELMGGTLQVESKLGKGSQFTVKLPLVSVQDNRLTQSESLDESLPHESISDVFILVAEDNEMNQKLIERILSQWKCKFKIVSNGIEVENELQNSLPDIILMDVLMPLQDGIITTQNIRKNFSREIKNIPIIGLTAQGSEEEKNICLQSGMNEIITKPFQREKLKEVILSALRSKKEFLYIDFSFFSKNGIEDQKSIREMVRIYLEKTPPMFEIINKAIEDNELKMARLEIHSLKSNAKIFGIQKLSFMLDEIEQQSSIEKTIKNDFLSTLNDLYKKSYEELKLYLKN